MSQAITTPNQPLKEIKWTKEQKKEKKKSWNRQKPNAKTWK